jgi:hypothetical protein
LGATGEKTRPGALEQKKGPHEHPRSFSAISDANKNMLSLIIWDSEECPLMTREPN